MNLFRRNVQFYELLGLYFSSLAYLEFFPEQCIVVTGFRQKRGSQVGFWNQETFKFFGCELNKWLAICRLWGPSYVKIAKTLETL